MPTFLLTFGTYGSHLPGDDRGSTRRGGGYHQPNGPLRAHAASLMTSAPVSFCEVTRPVVLRALLEVARYRGWELIAAHVRNEHVHCVVSGEGTASAMLRDFKAYSTRALREAGWPRDVKVWARHGSVRALHDERAIQAAAHYVHMRQGEPMARYPAVAEL